MADECETFEAVGVAALKGVLDCDFDGVCSGDCDIGWATVDGNVECDVDRAAADGIAPATDLAANVGAPVDELGVAPVGGP